jgi:hypothetical protein
MALEACKKADLFSGADGWAAGAFFCGAALPIKDMAGRRTRRRSSILLLYSG